MKIRIKIFLLFLSLLAYACVSTQQHYKVSSFDMGIMDFDITVTEVKRDKRTSVINVPGFHNRSAAASRWMMCVYNDLAVKRGFDYWIVIYPELPSENILVGFPESPTEDIVKTLGVGFRSEHIFPEEPASVGMFKMFCGIW